MANRLNAPLRNYLPRMIIKLYDNVILPDEKEIELDSYLEKEKILPWKKILEKYPKSRIDRLFVTLKPQVLTEMVKNAKEMNPEYKKVNLNNYLAMNCPVGTKRNKLLEDLKEFKKAVQNVYMEGVPVKPLATGTARNPRSPDQQYLDPSPTGIDARFAANVSGGDGTGSIKFIDIEQGWILGHEDFPDQQPAIINLLSGINTLPRGHGTSVLGIVVAQDNGRGGIGIVPSVKADVVSSIRSDTVINNNVDYNVADAILTAVHLLSPGDILLIEETSQIGSNFLPCEAEEHIFSAISTGTSLGRIIIEPAGNGNFDLDDFPDGSGKFVFKRPLLPSEDSGAIMVGAATSDVPHSRHAVSNFGSRIDCFAWGEHINTTGSRRTSYTTRFAGTSGASAIIAGAAISVQSMYEAALQTRLTPKQIRRILSDDNNGTTSVTPLEDKIGAMPDLKKIANLIQSGRA